MSDAVIVTATENRQVVETDAGTQVVEQVLTTGGGTVDQTARDAAAAAQATADTKQDSATAATDAELSAHASDTTAVHGITDTSALATSADLAGYQPLDSDLTAIAALATTSYGRSLLALADAAALQAAQPDGFLRSSPVATLRRQEMSANVTLLNNQAVMAYRVKAAAAGTFTKVRYYCAGAGSSVTGFRVGVWDSGGTLLGQTANHALTATNVRVIDLLASVTLTAGQELILGMAGIYSGSPTFRGVSFTGDTVGYVAGVDPVLGYRHQNAYTVAANPLGNLSLADSYVNAIPWLELTT